MEHAIANAGIQKMFDSDQVRFQQFAYFCPLPVEVMVASPNVTLSAVFNEEPSARCDKLFKQLISPSDWARRCRAALGQVKMRPITDRLIMMDESGQAFVTRIRSERN